MGTVSAGSSATVIGSGVNGLSAAIVMARAGAKVDVYEAEAVPGGACRTLELTLPGFLHDFGSAVHPMAAGSPFFQSLPLQKYGLEWIHSPVPLAHPFLDGSAITLERDIAAQKAALGRDGMAWETIFKPLASHWNEIRDAILRPFTPFSGPIWRHPLLMTRFGIPALLPATLLARGAFREAPARGLFAGLGAHSFLSLDAPLSASFGLVLGMVGHAIGWPIPRGGSQSITTALVKHFEALGGTLHLGQRVATLSDLPPADVTLCDITPRQLQAIAGERLTPAFGRSMRRYRYGPAAFKIDYALSRPIPWTARECLRAATVHVGGTMEDIAASESAMARGQVAERPFLLVAQSSLFDTTRVPGFDTTRVPQPGGNQQTALGILPRAERLFGGHGACHRESAGAVCAGISRLRSGSQRDVAGPSGIYGCEPGRRRYQRRCHGCDAIHAAADQRILQNIRARHFLCSSSTPPGGGVHGMCGHNAAQDALQFLKRK